ncbi:HAD hydrolase-like protein [Dankookia sp. GCM10030260]|uniref:HAD hydrolase-like protein n=1 Tax=Dankookia sp. GCM10030260 TaxID=3273390 RepID=UPI00360CEB46
MPPRLVIFDFDGTLADSFPWFRGALNEVGRRHGLRPVAPTEVEALRRLGTREILRALEVSPWRLPALTRDLRALKAAAAGSIPLFPGVPAMLRGLSEAGVALAIASSDGEASIRQTLGAEAAVVGQVAGGASLFGKAAKLRQVLRAAGVPAAEAVYIGDETRDAEAAVQVGLAFGAVTWGYAAAEALRARGPRWVFDAPGDILGLQ